MKCKICDNKLTGKKRSYCSEKCAEIGKSLFNTVWKKENKDKVAENSRKQFEKIKNQVPVKKYNDYTRGLSVDLMLEINRKLITNKKSKEVVLKEYEKDKNFRYIEMHIERVTKDVKHG